LRIDAVEVINLHYPYPPGRGFQFAGGQATGRLTTLVRVRTDDGLVGLGSAYSHPDLVRIIIDRHLTPKLLGADPTETDQLWKQMYRTTQWYGRKGVALSAVGALDVAFWDLRAQAARQPLWRMLGSEVGSVAAYASALLWQDNLETLRAEARRHLEAGFLRMKMRLGRNPEYDEAAFLAVRHEVGSIGDVMVDGSMHYTLDEALRLARLLDAEHAFWFEEPFAPDALESFAELRRQVRVPIALGENEFGVTGFGTVVAAGAADILQPDVSRGGGITECLRVASLAARAGLKVATHTWSDAVALVANAHMVASLPNGLTVEIDRTGSPLIDDLLHEPLTVREGRLQLSDSPGLGVTLDEDVVQRYRIPDDQYVPEGSYGDMIFPAVVVGARAAGGASS
jgi:L-alanine-DL-glutamate epimerase-like enolase superfamily enzyme